MPLCSDGRKIEAKDMWAAVRQLTVRRPVVIEGVNADAQALRFYLIDLFLLTQTMSLPDTSTVLCWSALTVKR